MKILSLLFSLGLGAAVLIFLLQPWDRLETMMGRRSTAMAPDKSPATVSPATAERRPATVPGAQTPATTAEAARNTHRLAAERAEAERTDALQQKSAMPVPRETKRYFKVTVRDNATLEAGTASDMTTTIRLEGITARSPEETCKRDDGETWPCGAKAKAALTRFIRARAVTCTLPPGGETKDFAARCSVMGQDLSTWLVRRGWAAPQKGAREFVDALDAAKSEKIGLWQTQ
jgi:endonuclease YncB( thermonuclease family)